MPKKTKATDPEQEIMEPGMEQHPAEDSAPENPEDGQQFPTEGAEYENPESGQSVFPENEHTETDAGESPAESSDENTGSEDGFGDSAGESAFYDEPDPALDPSLVVPTLPMPEAAAPDSEPEPDIPAEPETPKPAKKGTKAAKASADSESPSANKRIAGAALKKPQKESVTPSKRVVSIGDDVNIQTDEEREAFLWMELRNSLRGKRILTGILGGVERSPNGLCTAVVYYKDQRIVIPASEMVINIGDDVKSDLKTLYNRQAQILTRSLGAQIDFIVSGIDKRNGSVAASRKEAMLRKQQNFYLPTVRNNTPLISEGQVVEARVISVGDKTMRVEVFGVESSIHAREVAWEWVDDCGDYYRIGDRVLVKILRIDLRDKQNIRVSASIRDVISNPAMENIKKCTVQGKYIGKVTGVDKRAIYVRLNVGVNGLAIAVHDRKYPSRKDDVSFVITRIDKEAGIVIGIITKVIKQFV